MVNFCIFFIALVGIGGSLLDFFDKQKKQQNNRTIEQQKVGKNMLKKKLRKLLYIEQQTLVENNDELQNALMDYAIDVASFWVSEYLYTCPCDYSINNGYSYGDFFTIDIDKYKEFHAWTESNQKTFCFLSESEYTLVGKFVHYASMYENSYYENDFAYFRANALKEQLEDVILNRLRSEYDYFLDNPGNLTEIFWDYMEHEHDENELDKMFTDLHNIYIHVPEYTIKEHDSIII